MLQAQTPPQEMIYIPSTHSQRTSEGGEHHLVCLPHVGLCRHGAYTEGCQKALF